MKRLVVDLDDTLCVTTNGDYANAAPIWPMIDKVREYKALGFEIVLATSRNVRTYASNIGKINAHTLPIIIEWLNRHDIPFDEIYVGKPWCGHEGFYIDDKAIRPSEFLALSYTEITALISSNKDVLHQ